MALLPLSISLLILQRVLLKLKKAVCENCEGICLYFPRYFPLFVGVNGGFMEVGSQLGYILASLDNKFVCCLPLRPWLCDHSGGAVRSGTDQADRRSDQRLCQTKAVAASLSIGVSSAILLSAIRILCLGSIYGIFCCRYLIAIVMVYFASGLLWESDLMAVV